MQRQDAPQRGAPSDDPTKISKRDFTASDLLAGSGVRQDEAAIARALAVARGMAEIGIPIFTAQPDPNGYTESGRQTGFSLPSKWQQTRPNKYVVDHWKPGMALCAVCGVRIDAIDCDPRNGGDDAMDYIHSKGWMPESYGTAETPSGGVHEIITALGLQKKKRDGIDYQGGAPDGKGRGFIFIAPTVRISKVTGLPTPYRWIHEFDFQRFIYFSDLDTTGTMFGKWVSEEKNKGGNSQPSGETVYRGGFYIDAKHTGWIQPGMGHNAIVSFCGYLLKKYPDISWTDYEGLTHARWQEFDQSPFTWTWEECKYQVKDCWDRFERGQAYEVWTKAQSPFGGIIGKPTATPYTGNIGNPTSTPFAKAGRAA